MYPVNPYINKEILVVGAGMAGLTSALLFQRRFPASRVRILYSEKTPTINVGEGTTPGVVPFIHEKLGIDRKQFFDEVRPTWKLGARFEWGTPQGFNYPFGFLTANRIDGLSRPLGYYMDNALKDLTVFHAMMDQRTAFERSPQGVPKESTHYSYHLENRALVHCFRRVCAERNIEFVTGDVVGIKREESGKVLAVELEDGQNINADLFIDASGFRAMLTSALGVNWRTFLDRIPCDRAVVGGWERSTDDHFNTYTTVQTMPEGWSWRIDHEKLINRGYVYGSSFTSDDEAERIFREVNPKVTDTRVVPFMSGRRDAFWNENVLAVGNAAFFAEPLEANAIGVHLSFLERATLIWNETSGEPDAASISRYNRICTGGVDQVVDFLAAHYMYNGLLDTEFWKAARHDFKCERVERLKDYFVANGPSSLFQNDDEFPQTSIFGLDGYYHMFIGMGIKSNYGGWRPSSDETALVRAINIRCQQIAEDAFGGQEILDLMHSDRWRWPEEMKSREAGASYTSQSPWANSARGPGH
jgi:tryptophan halogenase